MQLGELLTTSATQQGADVSSKKRVLEVASEMLASSINGVDADTIFSGLLNRERLGSTGLGSGVGIPHCRIAGADRPAAALMTLAEPIDFDAIDSKPVDLICALIVPDDGDDEHLKTLAGLAELFSNSEALSELRDSSDDKTLYDNAQRLSRV
ncbi:MAG TPA: PTS sugar transporter subunit IIA [Marinobacterium sp.]|nr:PTS sugar transporter subunit IIA [Marinobacterium sp.]